MANKNNFPSDDELYEEYGRLVDMVIGKILGPKGCDHIAGVYQDTWLTIIEKVSTVRDPNALPGWLKRVAQRKAIKHLRKVHQRKDESFDDGREISDGGIASPERKIEAAERIARVLALAKTIKPPKLAKKFLQILVLLLDGLEFEEIALTLHETPANVRNIYYRGQRKLRRLLGDEPGGRPPVG